jgi:hypothetical protein
MTPDFTRGRPNCSPHPRDGGYPRNNDLHQMSDDGGPVVPDSPRRSDFDGLDNLGEMDTFDDPPPATDLRPCTHRVRFTCTGKSGQHRAADVESRDLPGGLDAIPHGLPPGAYILSVEDLAAGRAVHWTRWPAAYRPGFGG